MESEAKTLVADVSYFEPLELHLREKPYISNVPFAETEGAWDNLNQVKHSQEMVNIRGHEDEFSLPQHGFQYVQHSFSHSPTDHIHSLEHPYVKEVEEFLLARFGASTIFVYDASIRKVGVDGYFQQADAAHIDHTEENCLWRLELAMKHLGLLGVQPRRFQIITAWRPLMKQVTSWPLAVCDSSTVKSHECHKVDTIFPHYASEIYHLGHGCDHKWYFLGEQKESEVLLMQVYDSKFPERRGCPHMSFDLGNAGDEARRRDSVEARAVLIYLEKEFEDS